MSSYLLTRRGPITTLPVSGESKSQYVPHAVQLPNGDLWCVVKGDESRSIHAYRSQDHGQSFVYQGVVIPPSGGSGFDAYACLDPVLVYDPGSDTLHYLWKGHPTQASYGSWAIGHGTAPGANPLAVTRNPLPLMTSQTVQAYWPAWGTLTDLYVGDVIRDPWNVLTFFCGARDQWGDYRMFRCRGDWTACTPRSEGVLGANSPWTFVQAPSVYRNADGSYTMIFTEGHDTGLAGALHHTSATCPGDGNWAWVRSPDTFLYDSASGWDAKLAYAAALLKGGPKYDTPIEINGALQLFYSGQPMIGTFAQAGIAMLTPGGGELAVIG